MANSPVENRPRHTGANAAPNGKTPNPTPWKAAANRLPPPLRSSRPLPIPRPIAAAPPLPPLPARPTQTTAVAAPPPPPPPPPATAASTTRRGNADVTQIVAPLPPPIAQPAGGVRGRSPSPRGIVEPVAAEPKPAEAPPARAPVAIFTLEQARTPWADIKRGKVTYRAVGMPDRDAPKVPDHREGTPPPAGAPGKAASVRRLLIRTAALGAATLVTVVLVVAIGFSSEDLPHARAATELDRSPPPDPRPSPGPVRPAADDPAVPPRAAVEQAQGAPEPAGAIAKTTRPQSTAPSEDPRSAVTTPPPAPRTRPRSPAPSSSRVSATRDSGHAKPAGRSRARTSRPLTYDPDALFPDKR